MPPSDDAQPPPNMLKGLLGRFRRKTRDEGPISEEEANQAANIVEAAQSRRELAVRLAEFDNLRVKDVMVPRPDIIAVDASTSFEDMVALFAEAQVSRLPVFRETLDDPLGMIHVKDVLTELANLIDKPIGERNWAKLRRDILFVPPSMTLSALLLRMQSARCHLALVIDEYGGTDGLVSIEDLVEQIVGDIADEHDVAETDLLVERAPLVWEADARAPIDMVEERLGLKLRADDSEDEIDTLGGLVFTLLGRVPQRGEIVRYRADALIGGLEFEVLDADPRRIKKLRLRVTTDAVAEAAASAAGTSKAV